MKRRAITNSILKQTIKYGEWVETIKKTAGMDKFTKRELAELTGYTAVYLDKILREMKEMGMVRKIGAGTKIWWKLRRRKQL